MLNFEWLPEERIWSLRFTTGAAFSVTTNEYKKNSGICSIGIRNTLKGVAQGQCRWGDDGAALGFNGYENNLTTGIGTEYRFARHWAFEFFFKNAGYRFPVPRLTYLF